MKTGLLIDHYDSISFFISTNKFSVCSGMLLLLLTTIFAVLVASLKIVVWKTHVSCHPDFLFKFVTKSKRSEINWISKPSRSEHEIEINRNKIQDILELGFVLTLFNFLLVIRNSFASFSCLVFWFRQNKFKYEANKSYRSFSSQDGNHSRL